MIIDVKEIPARVVVAVEGAVNDWAAYAGNDSWDIDWISAHGDKISEDEARKLFPQFAHLHYRK